jgi:hypothetical protein
MTQFVTSGDFLNEEILTREENIALALRLLHSAEHTILCGDVSHQRIKAE